MPVIVAALSFGVAACLGCTALSDFDVHQCTVDADCDVHDGVRRCEVSQCVAGCSSNDHCASLDPRTPLCQYPGGRCVAAAAPDAACYMHTPYDEAAAGGLTMEDLLVVGAFAPTFRSPLWLTLELGARELNASLVDELTDAPPLLVVLCDPDVAAEAVVHLVNDLGARAIVASLEDAALRSATLASSAEAPLFLAPSGSTMSSVDLGDRAEHVRFLGGRYEDGASAYVSALQAAADASLARGTLKQDLKVASVIGGAAEDRILARAVRERLRVDGLDADALLGQGRYQTFELREASADERAAQLTELVSYAPHLVLFFAGGTIPDANATPRASIVHTLESNIGPTWQPSYVFGPRNLDDATLRRLAVASPSFRARAIGVDVSAPLDPMIASEVDAAFRATFPAAVTSDVNLKVSYDAYDALYYFVHASMASEGAPSSAAELLVGLDRITRPGAEVVPVGASGSRRVFDLLEGGAALDLHGTRGSLAFDTLTRSGGQPRLYCWLDSGESVDAGILDGDVLVTTGTACPDQIFPAP
ncbi:MAG TPA: hypothetical protein VNN80_21100 [Polyangiaceae bacterium]|nr:hypothetical protein [Polyangiaceae bacterium]